jgi:glycosyltransferase involved in cell wall biosynthesis
MKKPMRVLYLSQYFPPEVGATQTRAYEMARYLVSAGHRVTILAEVPNHPSGIIPPEYKGKLYERAEMDGIDVIRVWVKASPIKSFSTRMLFYVSYMINATLAGLLLARGEYDAIYATSPPLLVGGAALALSYLRRIPLFFEVRDLWPESAVALGEMSNPQALAMAGKLEEMCYNRARCIVVVTQGIQRRLEARGFGPKLAFIPNGANTKLFHPDPEAAAVVRRNLGFGTHGDEFLVVYAGIHGVAQGLETVLEAARHLANQTDVHFLLIGEGPRKAQLLALRDEWGLDNVTMVSEVPRAEMPAYLSAADVALVPLRRLPLFQGALPSKMFDAWACGCPVILSIEGEAREVLGRARGGVFVQPEDAEEMAQVVLYLRNRPEERLRMGENGRRFVEQNYSRQDLAAGLETLLVQEIERLGVATPPDRQKDG